MDNVKQKNVNAMNITHVKELLLMENQNSAVLTLKLVVIQESVYANTKITAKKALFAVITSARGNNVHVKQTLIASLEH